MPCPWGLLPQDTPPLTLPPRASSGRQHTLTHALQIVLLNLLRLFYDNSMSGPITSLQKIFWSCGGQRLVKDIFLNAAGWASSPSPAEAWKSPGLASTAWLSTTQQGSVK